MAYKGPDRRREQVLDGLAQRSTYEKTDIDQMDHRVNGRADTPEEIEKMRKAGKETMLRLAGYTTERVTQELSPVEAVSQSQEVSLDRPKEKDLRLDSLVSTIDALPEAVRRCKGKVRTGAEIARAIPDKEAFLAEVALMQEGTFFELNERGQLVMKDGCKEAYGLRDDFPAAQTRQKRLVYRDDAGKIQVLGGVNFTVDKETGDRVLPSNKGRIAAQSILMERGLPTLTWDGSQHLGEYARMNDKGQFERETVTWTEDDSLDSSRARYADWYDDYG